MHSVPERSKKDDKRSRFEQYGDDHPYTAFPNVDGFEYLTGLFLDSGIGSRAGIGGILPLTWSELKAFDDCGKLALSSWEFSQIMEMSRAYCNWNAKGSQQKDIADDVPYIDRTRKATDYIIRQREQSAKNAKDAQNLSKR